MTELSLTFDSIKEYFNYIIPPKNNTSINIFFFFFLNLLLQYTKLNIVFTMLEISNFFLYQNIYFFLNVRLNFGNDEVGVPRTIIIICSRVYSVNRTIKFMPCEIRYPKKYIISSVSFYNIV